MAEKKQPQAHDTFITSVDAITVIRNAKSVGRSAASQYAIIINITGSSTSPGS